MSELEPYIIIGAPGGGTSYFTKFLRWRGFFTGVSTEAFRDKVDHPGSIQRRMPHESLFITETLNKPLAKQLDFSQDYIDEKDFELLYEMTQLITDKYWEDLVKLNYDKFSGRLEEEFLISETSYGWKCHLNAFLLPFWKKIFPKSKVISLQRKYNPQPSGLSKAGEVFNENVKDEYFQKLYFNIDADFTFQFEDFTNLDKVNELLEFLELETFDRLPTLYNTHKQCKFQFFKVQVDGPKEE